jgi:hypothetical protein
MISFVLRAVAIAILAFLVALGALLLIDNWVPNSWFRDDFGTARSY